MPRKPLKIVDELTGESIELKNIRAIELRFDKIVRKDLQFILIQNDNAVATVNRECLSDKMVSMFDSLAEWELPCSKELT